MELRQLRYFVAVAQARSLSKAAQKVHIAQPALSRQMQMLEAELEAELLHRSGRGVELTGPGLQFLGMAQSILRDVDRIRPSIQDLRGVVAGAVCIGLSPTLAAVGAKQLLATCGQRYPLIKLHLVEGLSMFLTAWLEQSRLDMAVYSMLSAPPGAGHTMITLEELVVVGPPTLLRAWHTSISAAEAARLPLMLTPGFRVLVRARFEQEGIAQHEASEIDSVVVVKEIIRQGEYCSILPYSFVYDDVAEGRLTALHFSREPMLRNIAVQTRANSVPSRAVQRVSALVGEIFGGLPRFH